MPQPLLPVFNQRDSSADRYSKYETETFHIIGRFDGFKPTRNRMSLDPNVQAFMETHDLGPLDDYAVPDFDHDCVIRNLSKYNGKSVSLDFPDLALLAQAEDIVVRHYSAMRATTRVMDFDEVAAAVDLNKSPGYPWNRRYGTHQDVLDKHGDWVRNYVSEAYAGNTSQALWYAFPKEELRTTEKCVAGKIRHISGCTTEFKFLTNTLLLAQNEAFYSMSGHTWSRVGMNVFNAGWHDLASCLAQFPTGIEADISQMDADYQWIVATAVKNIRWALFPEGMRTAENRRLLDHIYEQIYRGHQVTPNGFVFAKEHGNASGSPLTVVDNTFATHLAIVYSYLRECRVLGVPPDSAKLEELVACAVYGDDNTMTVAEEFQSFMNHGVLTRGFGDLGWRLTFSSDSFVPWTELTFLSRGFFKYNGLWLPRPLDGMKFVHSLVKKGRPYATLASSYVRACGLHVAAYWDQPARTIISDFLDWCEPALMRNGLNAVLRNRASDAVIVEWYTGIGPHTQRLTTLVNEALVDV